MSWHVPQHLPPAGPDLLVALDLDGTLLTHMGQATDAVLDAVGRLAATGAHVVIATGRSVVATLPVLEAIGQREGYTVCANGAVTLRLDPAYEGGFDVVEAITFHPEATLRRLRHVLPDALFLVEDANHVRRVNAPFPEGELMGDPEVVDFEDLCRIPATRVTLRAPDLEAHHLHEAIDRAGLHGVSYAVGWTAWLDVAPEGVSKASALERVREHLRVSPFSTVAVGDGQNDHEMFVWASWAVAMGQASEETKAYANHVAGTVHQDGLVDVITALLER